jgi:hypothetical protein
MTFLGLARVRSRLSCHARTGYFRMICDRGTRAVHAIAWISRAICKRRACRVAALDGLGSAKIWFSVLKARREGTKVLMNYGGPTQSTQAIADM